jgi:threonine/homoserine/homoserine lactone efflux protein
VIKYIGAVYLVYIGFKALRSQGFKAMPALSNAEEAQKTMRDVAAFRSGFITNLFNPKATMFFLALFTQVISPETPLYNQFWYGVTCVVMTTGWFSFVALVLTHDVIQHHFLRFTKLIDRVCGGFMVGLGVKLALSKA